MLACERQYEIDRNVPMNIKGDEWKTMSNARMNDLSLFIAHTFAEGSCP